MSSSEGYSAKDEVGLVRTRRTWRQRAWIELKKAPFTAWLGMVVISIYVVIALFAPLIAPFGEAEITPIPYAPWGGDHLLGTDQIGRDILSRLIYGARNTIGIALATTFLAFLIGGGMALVAAINRGWIDQILSRVVDILMAIPSLIFALMLLSIFGSNVQSSRPVSGSSAMTRLKGVVKKRRPSTTIGVDSNAVPRFTRSGRQPPDFWSPCR